MCYNSVSHTTELAAACISITMQVTAVTVCYTHHDDDLPTPRWATAILIINLPGQHVFLSRWQIDFNP